jgi:peptidoglycan hydrolase-like protein with peptidoglycan-binding domain
MTARSQRDNTAAELQRQPRSLDQAGAIIARSETRVARTIEAIHGLGYSSVAQALARDDGAGAAHAATPAEAEWLSSKAREKARAPEQPAGPTDDPISDIWDDRAQQGRSSAVERQTEQPDEGRPRARSVGVGKVTPLREAPIAPEPLLSSTAGDPDALGLTPAIGAASKQPVLQLRRQRVLAGLRSFVWVVGAAAVITVLISISLGRLDPPASKNPPPVAPSRSEPVRTATATTPSPESAQPAPKALPEGTHSGAGFGQPEPSTVTAPQEPTTPKDARPTSPPSEDDLSPVENHLALLPSVITTPGPADNSEMLPMPLLDLGQVEDAKLLQQRLIDLGFLFGTADGRWGPRSRTALRDFRRAQGIGESDTWDREAQQNLFSQTAASAPPTASFVGGWGIDADQCRQASDNRPPIAISARRAEAFGTMCEFNSTQREAANEWRIRATCADEGDRWNANIRLTLSGNRLRWTSERGTTTYLRCPRS